MDIKVGESVLCRRKITSKIYHNLIAGPVSGVWPNALTITTNEGTALEADFRLYYSDWEFEVIEARI